MTGEQRGELKRLAEAVRDGKRLRTSGRKWRAYRNAANPTAVLDLLAENERLRTAMRSAARDLDCGTVRGDIHRALLDALEES